MHDIAVNVTGNKLKLTIIKQVLKCTAVQRTNITRYYAYDNQILCFLPTCYIILLPIKCSYQNIKKY